MDNYRFQGDLPPLFRVAAPAPEQLEPSPNEQESQLELPLEQDLYTNAFVSCLDLPDCLDGPKRRRMDKVCAYCMSILLMLLIATVQIVSLLAVQAHIDQNMEGRTDDYVYMAYEIFLGANATMPIELSKTLCGDYEQVELAEGSQQKLTMPDGTQFEPSLAMPMFYPYKVPSDSWQIARMAGGEMSLIDNMLYVIHDGLFGLGFMQPGFGYNGLWADAIGYSHLFLLMISMLACTLIVEYRNIYCFASMLCSFVARRRLSNDHDKRIEVDMTEGMFHVMRLNNVAVAIGSLAVLLRILVSTLVILVGFDFLINTTLKLELIFNSLALVFILEFDSVAHLALVSHSKIDFIRRVKPIRYTSMLPKCVRPAAGPSIFPAFGLTLVIFVGLGCRILQIREVEHRLNMLETLCLFVGPTPDQRTDVVAPATGFCESLLSATCAPQLTGPGVAHGPCVVTDFGAFYKPTLMIHTDGQLFENMTNSSGEPNNWINWGLPRRELLETQMWVNGPYQNTLRKICALMYQPSGKVDNRIVDRDTSESANGAPFYCDKRHIMEAVFGNLTKAFGSSSREKRKPPTRTLQNAVAFISRSENRWYDTYGVNPRVASAIQNCRPKQAAGNESIMLPTHEALRNGEGSGRYFLERVEAAASGWPDSAEHRLVTQKVRHHHPEVARKLVSRRKARLYKQLQQRPSLQAPFM